jgi:cell division protein YceG involved in septum cleavage
VKQDSGLRYTQPTFAKKAWLIRAIRPLVLWLAFLPGFSAAQDDSVLPPGAYRLEMIMATVSRLPFLGSSKSASKSVSMVEVRREGSDLIQSHQVCDFRVLEDSAMIKMVFSDKFVAALAKHTYPIQIEKDAQGWLYRADLGVERIGY